MARDQGTHRLPQYVHIQLHRQPHRHRNVVGVAASTRDPESRALLSGRERSQERSQRCTLKTLASGCCLSTLPHQHQAFPLESDSAQISDGPVRRQTPASWKSARLHLARNAHRVALQSVAQLHRHERVNPKITQRLFRETALAHALTQDQRDFATQSAPTPCAPVHLSTAPQADRGARPRLLAAAWQESACGYGNQKTQHRRNHVSES